MERFDEKEYEEEIVTEEGVEQEDIKPKAKLGKETNKIFQWVENVLILIQSYGLRKIFLALFLIVVCVLGIMAFNVIRDEELVKKFIIGTTEMHDEASRVRKEVDPKIGKTLTRMLYSMNADRVSVLEMHNGKENPTSLPFLYCDMTYEETKDNVSYVAEEYENLNMSKFQFPTYLYEHRVFYGTVEEIMEIDKKLGMRLELNNVCYIGMVLIRTNTDIGFVTISWMEEPALTRDVIIADLTYYVQEIGTYLDYGQYQKINR